MDRELDSNIHSVIDDSYGNQKANYLFLTPIDPDGLDLELVKNLEIDLRQGHVSAGRYFIQEALERILSDDDLIDFVNRRCQNRVETSDAIIPRPLVPRSLIKSRMRYIPGIAEQRSSSG